MIKKIQPLLLLLSFLLTISCSQANDVVKIKKENLYYKYLLDYPPGFEEDETYPLMIFLHGAGERGNDVGVVRMHGPPKLAAAGKAFPCIILSPQCPFNESWKSNELEKLLEYIIQEEHIDQKRIYLTGLSMGGYGTWSWSTDNPENFAALIPICGGGNPNKVESIQDIPVWVFHGAKDSVVPLEQSEKMVEALRALGADPKFTIYPEAGHDSWTKTYNNQLVYDWMFSQKRE